jgi:hypothetical protein
MEHDPEEYGFAFETVVHPQIVDDTTDFHERNQTAKPFNVMVSRTVSMMGFDTV